MLICIVQVMDTAQTAGGEPGSQGGSALGRLSHDTRVSAPQAETLVG